MTNAVLAEGLAKRFGETTALAGVDLAARTGSVLGILGPNGAGKTTAVRILATLLTPDAGHAEVCGHDVVRDAHRVRRLVGLTGQYASVDEMLTGAETCCSSAAVALPRAASRSNRWTSTSSARTLRGPSIATRTPVILPPGPGMGG